MSEPVARALADGARRRLGATYGIGITGVAGPGGGSESKPVGTVPPGARRTARASSCTALARFPGDRERVRWQASQLALELLRRQLLRQGAAPSPEPSLEAAG